MALPVKFTVKGAFPEGGEAAHDASSGVAAALAFMVKESLSWVFSLSVTVRVTV